MLLRWRKHEIYDMLRALGLRFSVGVTGILEDTRLVAITV